MFYTIYKITNQIDGKFYIGSHKTKDLNDDYMGSGKYLRHAQEKYGIENFTKEVLFVFDTPEQMYDKEAEIVNEDFLATENTYNIKVGGFGGWDFINQNKLNGFSNVEVAKRGREITNKLLTERYGSLSMFSSKIGKLGGQSCKNKKVGIHDPAKKQEYAEIGRIAAQSPDAREKRKRTLAEIKHQQGEKNSQYGKMWITNGIESMMIHKNDIISSGWKKGRVLKNKNLE
jgi:hypothetical protein